MLDAADPESISGIRIRGLIGVLYGSALRISEALNLLPRDVDFENKSVFVRRGKGSKDRTVGIDPKSRELVRLWMDKRIELGLSRQHYIFAVYRGKTFGNHISRRFAAQQLVDLGELAGIEKRVHPHGMRHSAAFHLANTNVPVHRIQRQLGHKNLQMTSNYISHLSPQDVIDAMEQRTW